MANIAEPIPTGSSITTKEGAIKLGIKDTTGGIVKMESRQQQEELTRWKQLRGILGS